MQSEAQAQGQGDGDDQAQRGQAQAEKRQLPRIIFMDVSLDVSCFIYEEEMLGWEGRIRPPTDPLSLLGHCHFQGVQLNKLFILPDGVLDSQKCWCVGFQHMLIVQV